MRACVRACVRAHINYIFISMNLMLNVNKHVRTLSKVFDVFGIHLYSPRLHPL